MINKNARSNNKRRHNRKKKYIKTKEKLGIIISIVDFDKEINIEKTIRKSRKQNIRIIELVEFNKNDPVDNIIHFLGLINIITRYQNEDKDLVIIIENLVTQIGLVEEVCPFH